MHNRGPAYRPDAHFAIRAATLPFEEITSWSAGLSSDLRAEGTYERAIAVLTERLRAIVQRPLVREAIFLATPGLEDALAAWESAPASPRGNALTPALSRYVARMAGRATPFGLFATVSLGRVGPRTELVLDDARIPRRRVRLDPDYLCGIAAAFERDPVVGDALICRPNDTIYRVAGRLRYIEGRIGERGTSHHLVQAEVSDALDAALRLAAGGITAARLVSALAEEDLGIDADEARELVRDLLDAQLLVTDLRPLVTADDAVAELVGQLSSLPGERAAAAVRLVASASAELRELDAEAVVAPARYRDVARRLEAVPSLSAPKFQVDAFRPAPAAELGSAVVDELLEATFVMQRMMPRATDPDLEAFTKAFRARFGDAEVPIAIALDPDIGVPFQRKRAAPPFELLRGVDLAPHESAAPATFGARERILLDKLHAAWSSGAREIELTAQDVDQLSFESPMPLPDAFAVFASVAALPDGRPDEHLLLFRGATGPSGMKVLARFCHLDRELEAHVRRHLRAEEALQPDLVFAEVVHRPEGRLGTVIGRPILRQHELTLLERSAAPVALPVLDLQVSVRDGRVRLRSAELDREIAPFVTSAILPDHPKALDLARFLSAIKTQGVHPEVGWSWGPLATARFLPRVRHGRIVLSRARWRLDAEELRRLSDRHGRERFTAAEALRAALGMPRFVRLKEHDHELLVDWENPLLVDGFVALVGRRDACDLVEVFPSLLAPGPASACTGTLGHYEHELVVSYVRTAPATAVPPLAAGSVGAASLPGGACLYAKVYGSHVLLESLLVGELAELIGSADETLFERWFFIRYADPDAHLRLRFFGDPARLHGPLLERLHALLEEQKSAGVVWKVQLETYEPEVERYGGLRAIALAETLFHVESAAALSLLAHLQDDDRGRMRWRCALLGVHRLMGDLGLAPDERIRVLTDLRDRLGKDIGGDETRLRQQLGAKFREHRATVERLLANEELEGCAEASEVLAELSRRRASIAEELRALGARGELGRPMIDLAASFAHMFLNRILRPPAIAQELVVYDVLRRAYVSARERKRPPLQG